MRKLDLGRVMAPLAGAVLSLTIASQAQAVQFGSKNFASAGGLGASSANAGWNTGATVDSSLALVKSLTTTDDENDIYDGDLGELAIGDMVNADEFKWTGSSFDDLYSVTILEDGEVTLNVMDREKEFRNLAMLNGDYLKLKLWDLDGNLLAVAYEGETVSASVAAGQYSITAAGTATGSLGSAFTGKVSLGGAGTVPVPAAAWLFGSALLGLAGLKRRS